MASRQAVYEDLIRSADDDDRPLQDMFVDLTDDLDARITAVEQSAGGLAEIRDSLIATGQQQLQGVIDPLVTLVRKAADLGALLVTSSVTEASVGLGLKTFVVVAADLPSFAPAARLVIAAADAPSVALYARKVAYDRATGALQVEVLAAQGSGTYTSWTIGPGALVAHAGQMAIAPIAGVDATTTQAALEAIFAKFAANLSAISGLPTAATDKLLSKTAAGAWDFVAVTDLARTLLAASSRAAVRQAIGASEILSELRAPKGLFPGLGPTAATRSAMGATLTGSSKWQGMVLAPDGKIYGVPNSATDILIIDPASGTATRSAMGATLTGSNKWVGGALGRDGKIYCAPSSATDILIIDPASGTATRSAMGAPISGSNLYRGAVAAPDGKIYCIPYTASDILIIDPATQSAIRTPMGLALSEAQKWVGGALGVDGKIYCVPFNAPDILIIDPATQSAIRSTMGATISGTSNWAGAAIGPEGRIFCAPYNAPDILILDPATGTASRSAMGVALSEAAKYQGAVTAPDGKIYCMPSTASAFLVIDPTANTAALSAFGATLTDALKFYGGALAMDGSIYGSPSSSTDIIRLGKFAANFRSAALLGGHLNKF